MAEPRRGDYFDASSWEGRGAGHDEMVHVVSLGLDVVRVIPFL